MATIKINSAVMRDKSATLTSVSSTIRTLTDELLQEMDRLKSTWEGEVAETTVQKFKALSDDFEERYVTIDSYANFLENAATEWDRINAENLQNAQSQA